MKKKKYKRVVDNKMRGYGDIDFDNHIIRVNKKRSKEYSKKNKKAGVLDTIVHEETHRKHPRMHEKTVRKKTKKAVKKMSQSQKNREYKKYISERKKQRNLRTTTR